VNKWNSSAAVRDNGEEQFHRAENKAKAVFASQYYCPQSQFHCIWAGLINKED